MTEEKCPKCGCHDFLIARDMIATRKCKKCHHTWVPEVKVVDHKSRIVNHYQALFVCLTCHNKWIDKVEKGTVPFDQECKRCGKFNSFPSFIPPNF